MATPDAHPQADALSLAQARDLPEGRYLGALSGSRHHVVIVTDARQRIRWVNAGFEALTGYTLAEVVGKVPGHLLQCPGTDDDTLTRLRVALHAGRGARERILNRSKSGQEYWLDMDIQPLHDAHGELEGFIALETDVTSAMQESRQLRTILDTCAAGIVVQDARGRITDCNPAAEQLLGLTREQLLGRDSADPRWHAFGEDQLPLRGDEHPAMVALRTRRPVRDAVIGVQTAQGQRRWLRVNADVIEDAQPPSVVSSFTEITAQRQLQATLEEEQYRLRDTLDGIRAGVWEWNVQTGAMVVNARWAEIVGHALADLEPVTQARRAALAHPDDQALCEAMLQRHFAGEEAHYDIECRLRHRQGHWVWVRERGRVATWSPDGRPLLMFGTQVEITERKQAELALNRAHAKLQGLFELSPVGIALTDLVTGRFIDFNEALLKITGYTREEFSRMTYWDITPREFVEQEAVQLRALIESGRLGPYEKEYLHKAGHRVPVLLTGMRVTQPDGQEQIWSIVQDISPRREMERELHHAARSDRLTGLPNRALLMERLERRVAAASSHPAQRFAVLFLDFDRFKLVNDSLGHEAGDLLLQQIAQRLRATLRTSDVFSPQADGNLVARFGGDEFVVLLSQVNGAEDAERVADRLLAAFETAYEVRGHELFVTASIGIVLGDARLDSAESVLRNADLAMYEAKRAGRARRVMFDAGMHQRLSRSLALERELRHAVERNELSLVYQPVVDLQDGHAVGAEALLRWQHPEYGLVAPTEFVPIAEDSGLIVPIGEWVLAQACRQWRAWQRERPELAPPIVSVNLSRVQLASAARLLQQVPLQLQACEVPANALQLEVTERGVMEDAAGTRALMQRLRDLGVRLAMDDFGVGTSSLGSLRDFPFDTIKIDKSFVRELSSGAQARALLLATVQVVRDLGMHSVAEGIEDASQLATLRDLGCRQGQGYLFSHPVTGERLLEQLQAARQVVAARPVAPG